MSESRAFNMDCMVAMKEFPDKYFDLAVVDPPYGIGITGTPGGQQSLHPVRRNQAETLGWRSVHRLFK